MPALAVSAPPALIEAGNAGSRPSGPVPKGDDDRPRSLPMPAQPQQFSGFPRTEPAPGSDAAAWGAADQPGGPDSGTGRSTAAGWAAGPNRSQATGAPSPLELPPGGDPACDPLPWLWRQLPLGWLLKLPCPLCRRPLGATAAADGLCDHCRQRLALPPQGLQGSTPLPWWSSGLYADQLRLQLLRLRRQPRLEALKPLTKPLRVKLTSMAGRPWLVPIPSWKVRANPLPELLVASLCQGGAARRSPLLERSRPVLGQHRLGRQLRLHNQADAFRCLRPAQPGEARLHPLLIVDDILTTGATACSAASCLEAAGWKVAGLLCLARTPQGPGHDLRSNNGGTQVARPGRDSSVGRAGD